MAQLARNDQTGEYIEWNGELGSEDSGTEIDWDEDLVEAFEHPLFERAQDLSFQLIAAEKDNGWAPEGASEEHPAVDLVNAAPMASVAPVASAGPDSVAPDSVGRAPLKAQVEHLGK